MPHFTFQCLACKETFDVKKIFPLRCAQCKGILDVCYASRRSPGAREWTYETCASLLPIFNDHIVSLNEGHTPLIQDAKVFLKNETCNPTGSFKDRSVALSLSYARWCGFDEVVTASSGNTAVSVCHYAAQSGFKAKCYVPAKTSAEKLTWLNQTGADVVEVPGDFAKALHHMMSNHTDVPRITTTHASPFPMEANKLVAYELYQQMNAAIPDWILIPVGAGPLLTGIYKGYQEIGQGMPRLAAIQVAACAPIVDTYKCGASETKAWDVPGRTIAEGISDTLHGYADEGTLTLARVRNSHGCAAAISDEEVLQAQASLRERGIHTEPTGAVGFGGYTKLVQEGLISPSDSVVILITGGELNRRNIFSM